MISLSYFCIINFIIHILLLQALCVMEEIVHYLHMNQLLTKHLKWVITSELNELLLISSDEKEIHVQLKHASIQCPVRNNYVFCSIKIKR
jgi:hypothetical protein